MSSVPPSLTLLDRRWIKTLAHETRVAILRHMLTVETTTPTTLANALDEPLSTISYHVRRLHAERQIRLVKRVPRGGALAHHYRLADPRATAEAFDRLGLAHADDGPARPGASRDDAAIGTLLGELEAACVVLERLGDRLRVASVSAEGDVAAIPPSVLADLRHGCRSIARHSIDALSTISRHQPRATADGVEEERALR